MKAAARRLLQSEFLCERAERVSLLAAWIADFREFRNLGFNRRAVLAAAWLQDTWCCVEVQAGRFAPPMVLAVQPTDLQRESAADLVAKALAGAVDESTRAAAVKAIRQMASHDTIMPEARIVREAVNLDSIGLLWLWGQAARGIAEDRTVASVVSTWERQSDYRYWERRIEETLQFERSRQLARHRCSQLDACLTALRDTLTGGDRHLAPETPSR